MPQTEGGWFSNLWNNSALGKIIPDVIYVNHGGILNYLGGGGYNTGLALQLKGKEGIKLYSTLTLNLKAGAHGAFGVNFGYGSYVGDSRNFSFIESFGGEGTIGYELDFGTGLGASRSNPDSSGGSLYLYDIGFGPGIGGSLNIGSTTYVSPFKWW